VTKKNTERGRLADRKAALRAADQEAARRIVADEWQAAFKEALAGEPVLVERVDRTGAFYFIVPFSRGRQVTARILLDGYTLQPLMVSGIERGERRPESVTTYVTREEAQDRLTAQLESDQRQAGGRSAAVFRGLVWKPCRQSPSPQLPFYRFEIGRTSSGKGREAYVRVDGEIFGALDDRRSGG